MNWMVIFKYVLLCVCGNIFFIHDLFAIHSDMHAEDMVALLRWQRIIPLYAFCDTKAAWFV